MSLEGIIIDYQENKEDIEHWVTLKGEFRYKKIISFMQAKNIECNWHNVTSYIKYDKRILINSFKYIVFLEEMYKSFIYKFKRSAKPSSMDFQQAYHEYLALGEQAVFDGVDLVKMGQYKDSITKFRNKVAHNCILLNGRFRGASLEEVLEQLVEIMPHSYRKGFINDINACAKGLVEDENLWHIELRVD